jgi:hypothetical protein
MTTLHSAPRRGVIMMIVIVCVVVATAICGLLVRMAVLGRSATEAQHRRLQAQWLAEAGIERAVARLAQDPRYSGETWTLPPEDHAAPGAAADGGVVRIVIAPAADQAAAAPPGRRLVRVEARYPNDPIHGCLYKKEIVVETPER